MPKAGGARDAAGFGTRTALVLAATTAVVAVVERVHLASLRPDPASAVWSSPSRLRTVEERARALSARLSATAATAAKWPETSAALAGDRAALSRLFAALEEAGRADPRQSLAVRGPTLAVVAWAGPAAEIRGLGPSSPTAPRTFVLAGSVTTTLVALAPVPASGAPTLPGYVTAEIPLRVKRNIHNQFLADFDLLADGIPGIEVRYADARDPVPEPFPSPLPGTVPSPTTVLAGHDGSVLGIAQAAPVSGSLAARRITTAYRRALVALGWLAAAAWALGQRPGPRPWGSALLAVTAARLVLLLAGGAEALFLPFAAVRPDRYSSPLLSPLLATPVDLLATALWTAVSAACLAELVLRRPSAARSPSPWRVPLALVVAFALAGGAFAFVGDTVARTQLDLGVVSLVPASGVHFVIHIALLLILASGLVMSSALFAWSGPMLRPRRGVLLLLGFATLAAVALGSGAAWAERPWALVLALVAGALATGATSHRWRPALVALDPVGQSAAVLGVTAYLTLLLYSALAFHGDREIRGQIERVYAPLVRDLPQQRVRIVEESARLIDELGLLEEAPEAAPPGVEELAFAVWSSTQLPQAGASAVEIRDAQGNILSRFALDLPSLAAAGPPQPLPPADRWTTTRETITVATAERPVLHARRRLTYDNQVRGALHLYVAEDFSGLPFLQPRDPYMALYRIPPRAFVRAPSLNLFSFDQGGALAWSSAERAPVLPAALPRRLAALTGSSREARVPGIWTTLAVDDTAAHVFFFAEGDHVHGLAFNRVGPGRYAAGLLEALVALGLAGALVVLGVLAARSLLGRSQFSIEALVAAVRSRFALRLFVSFLLLALVPVSVLVLARRILTERLAHFYEDQALERAAFAQKAVADFALFQRREAPGSRPVTDPALVWVASLIRNDLDVFGRGRLLASSKREMYASGLLAARLSGSVYRDLVLEARPQALRTESIGLFAGLVAYVPVALGGTEPAVLSIPLAVRQREQQSTLDELDRAMKLSALGFLLIAGLAAHSMSRRISGPLRDLTAATRRIADGDLGTRVHTSNRDEILALVDSFNRMAGDLERQRDELEKSNRLAAWAEMARQVAHEVKNPLTPIQLSAEHLRRLHRDRSADFDDVLDACTDTILKQVHKLRSIVTEFSAFARPPATALGPEDLHAVAAAVAKPYLRHLPPGVSLDIEAPGPLPSVLADRRLLERALLNVLENALQAVGDGGHVTIRLRHEPGEGRVYAEVEDDGPGLSPEARARVFEPFFSTKSDGSGLGLALVKKIVEDHGGGVALESDPGRGARVTLWLPAPPL